VPAEVGCPIVDTYRTWHWDRPEKVKKSPKKAKSNRGVIGWILNECTRLAVKIQTLMGIQNNKHRRLVAVTLTIKFRCFLGVFNDYWFFITKAL
jgi:hypothetical protein